MALKRGDVDLAAGIVGIQRAWRYVPKDGYQLGPPKTKPSVGTIDVAASVLVKLVSALLLVSHTQQDFSYRRRS